MATPAPVKYVAFLRGINVGGNKTIKMAELTRALEKSGLSDVKTILASGNVLFSTKKSPVGSLQSKLEKAIQSSLGVVCCVVVRSVADLEKLADSKPFAGVKPDPDLRQFVTFGTCDFTSSDAGEKPKTPNYKIVRRTTSDLCITFVAAPGLKTPDVMADLDKRFGRSITTRTWNTIEKILAATR